MIQRTKRPIYRTYKKKTYKPRNKVLLTSQIEMKKMMATFTTGCNQTGPLTIMNGLVKGTDEFERVGRKVTIKSIHLKGILQVYPATGVDQFHRIIVVRQKQTINTPSPQVLDVLATTDIYSLRNKTKLTNYQVLYDKIFQLNAANESGAQKIFNFYKKCNIITTYNAGNAGSYGDLEHNALYFITLGSEAPGTTGGTFKGQCQINFTDL